MVGFFKNENASKDSNKNNSIKKRQEKLQDGSFKVVKSKTRKRIQKKLF
jgi:hypothetical protein